MEENRTIHKKRILVAVCGAVAVLITAVVILLATNGLRIFSIGMPAPSYSQTERFSPGISIAGIDLSGMTKEQALQTLTAQELYPEGYELLLTYQEQTISVTGKDLPFDLRLQQAVDQAYAYNWHCTQKEHTDRVSSLAVSPQDFTLEPTLLTDQLEPTLAALTASCNRTPQEPTITDFQNGVFSISQPVDGVQVNTAALANAVSALLQTEKTGTLPIPTESLPCAKTAEEVRANMKQLGSFSTVSTNTANGNHNMRLAANATNGTVLAPGGSFSFNNTTGDTTNASNGYRPATAISGGKFVQEYGGGICQVSSTIYGAALRSNMTILSRTNHTYPSSYVPIGLDATVSYGAVDFMFRNDTDYPVYIAAGMDGATVWVTLYGYQSPDYDTIEPTAWITETIAKPAAQYQTDNALTPNPNPSGAAVLRRAGNAGYKTAASRTFYKNGAIIKTESLSSSYYPPFCDLYALPPQGTTPEPPTQPTQPTTPEPPIVSEPESTSQPENSASSQPPTESQLPSESQPSSENTVSS